jgi:hypothetical protein
MTLAYFNSMVGMVPCQVVAVGDWSDGGSQAKIKATASRGAYKRGELITTTLRNVVPRNAVYRRAGTYHIRPYQWPQSQ